MCQTVQKMKDKVIQFLLFISLLLAPVISITEAGRDLAENGRELHSDSKVCVFFRFMEKKKTNLRLFYCLSLEKISSRSIQTNHIMHMYECGRWKYVFGRVDKQQESFTDVFCLFTGTFRYLTLILLALHAAKNFAPLSSDFFCWATNKTSTFNTYHQPPDGSACHFHGFLCRHSEP